MINQKQDELYEKLAELEHIQWEYWSKTLANELHNIKVLCYAGKTTEAIQDINSRIERWEKNWKPYNELTEEIKQFDRVWVDKIIDVVNDLKDEFEKEESMHRKFEQDEIDAINEAKK